MTWSGHRAGNIHPGFKGCILWCFERFAIKRGNNGKIFTYGGMGKSFWLFYELTWIVCQVMTMCLWTIKYTLCIHFNYLEGRTHWPEVKNVHVKNKDEILLFLGCQCCSSFDHETPFPGAKAMLLTVYVLVWLFFKSGRNIFPNYLMFWHNRKLCWNSGPVNFSEKSEKLASGL